MPMFFSLSDLRAVRCITTSATRRGCRQPWAEQIDAETDTRLQAISDAAEDAWDDFRLRCVTYAPTAHEGRSFRQLRGDIVGH